MKIFKTNIVSLGVVGFFFLTTLFFNTSAQAASAEYKCTNKCTFCVTVDKKVICSEKYAEDSELFEKGRQLKKFVNEGLIEPDDSLRQGFTLENFNQKFFNCELMIKKSEQIQDATQKMCVAKTVRYEKTVITKRVPANVPVKVKAKAKSAE